MRSPTSDLLLGKIESEREREKQPRSQSPSPIGMCLSNVKGVGVWGDRIYGQVATESLWIPDG